MLFHLSKKILTIGRLLSNRLWWYIPYQGTGWWREQAVLFPVCWQSGRETPPSWHWTFLKNFQVNYYVCGTEQALTLPRLSVLISAILRVILGFLLPGYKQNEVIDQNINTLQTFLILREAWISNENHYKYLTELNTKHVSFKRLPVEFFDH